MRFFVRASSFELAFRPPKARQLSQGLHFDPLWCPKWFPEGGRLFIFWDFSNSPVVNEAFIAVKSLLMAVKCHEHDDKKALGFYT